jgi:hypothetical protein
MRQVAMTGQSITRARYHKIVQCVFIIPQHGLITKLFIKSLFRVQLKQLFVWYPPLNLLRHPEGYLKIHRSGYNKKVAFNYARNGEFFTN